MSKSAFVFLLFVFGQCWGELPPDSPTLSLPIGEGILGTKVVEDTVKQYDLGEVSVETSRLSSFITGSKVEKIDSNTLERFKNGNLSDLLSQNNFLLVKTYSPGNLSTISLRGTGINQTAMLWNGFNIQSSMNGTSDLA